MIDASHIAWSMPTPTLGRDYLCGGTTIELDGWRGTVASRDLSWLHAALTGVLGRGHGRHDNGATQVQDFSLLPWSSPSGWAAAWWSIDDAERVAGRVYTSRLGRTPTALRLGPLVRVHAPPAYARVAHAVTLHALSPVVIASTTGRSRGALARGDTQRKVYRTDVTRESLEHAICGLARKLGVRSDGVRVEVISSSTRVVPVRRRGRAIDASGWVGTVRLVCSPPARWLLECAARGLGLGARVAFGCGRVEVQS